MKNTTGQALVAPSDIAEMASVSRGAVSNWRKRNADFPEAVSGTAAKPLFARNAVLTWLASRGHAVVQDSGEAHVWSTLNTLRGDIPAHEMGELVLALACARKLAEESAASSSLWDQICAGNVAEDGTAFVHTTKAENGLDPRWASLVSPSDHFDHRHWCKAGVVAMALDTVYLDDLPSITDYALAKITRAQIREGLEHGFVESRISEALGNLAAATGGKVLYDPACGTGTALLSALDVGLSPDRVIGHDISAGALRQAAQRAFLRDVDIELARGDVLAHDLDDGLLADVIIAEPPFGMAIRPGSVDLLDRRWAFGAPTPSSSETLWIQHTVAHLAESGRGFVVTSDGALFRGGSDKAVRTELVRRGCVEAVIHLPGKMLPHTSINLNVWVLQAPAHQVRPDILFVDASNVEDVEKQIGTWLPALDGADIDVPHSRADIREILAADADLSAVRWIQFSGPSSSEVANTYLDSWKRLNTTIDRISGLSNTIDHFAGTSGAHIVTVGELIDQGLLEMRPGRIGASDVPEDLQHVYVTHSQIRNGEIPDGEDPDKVPANLRADLTQDGDVLVTTQGSIAAKVDPGGGHLLGYGIYRLRSTDGEKLTQHYLELVLPGSWNDRFQRGSGIGRAEIRLLEVPLVPVPEQRHAHLADMSVNLLAEQANALLLNAELVRESMLDALRHNVAIPVADL
ncbi:N-6 DNA methylase [Rhodococcus baikonurensis]|uniref:N-6 DNA methylase n=1 Tax=Rhodococcus baikonurensis TaxID=172041 RepID=UPI0037ADF49F